MLTLKSTKIWRDQTFEKKIKSVFLWVCTTVLYKCGHTRKPWIPAYASVQSIHSPKSNFSGKCQMVEGKCFVPLSVKLSFKAASEKCISKGGKLFEPREESINFQVLTAAWKAFNNDTNKRFWIGITDQQEEGT